MRYTITKDFCFEAAHRLAPPYKGKCAHIHGHSFIVRVTVGADQLDECGFVRDFPSLKPLKEWIDSAFDHATLVAERDTELRSWLEKNDQKHFVTEINPTSEAIAKLIYIKAEELGFTPLHVEIAETCTSSARYHGEQSSRIF